MGRVSLCSNEFACLGQVSIVGSLGLQKFCVCERIAPCRVYASKKNAKDFHVGDRQVQSHYVSWNVLEFAPARFSWSHR